MYVILALVAVCLYLSSLAVYRLYLSPIAEFPGPKLAALTRWYEFYYEVILRGQFTFHISQLHREYGPIVRINPYELHIADSEYWETLYGPGRVDKYEYFINRQNIPRSIFATPQYHIHRRRKAPLLPLFSKKRISDFQPVIGEKLDLLCSKIDQYLDGRPFAINRALTAFSGDVITTYVFGQSYQHLESPDFKDTFQEPFMAASEAGHVALQFKFIYPLMEALPEWLVLKMQPQIHLILQLAKDFDTKLKAIVAGTAKENLDQPTILYEMLRSELPPEDKQIDRLNEEAQLLVAAGLTTASWAMSVATFHIIENKSVYKELHSELVAALPRNSAFEWSDIESLPYLNACIREGLRLSYGVTARSPRLWDKPLQYQGWTIPARTPVSLTIVDHNHNEAIFPDSSVFRPERWLEQTDGKWQFNKSMERYFFAFGKGSRSCLGVNLAMAEMHFSMAELFRKFEFQLFETDISDVVIKHDFFLPSPRLDSKGIRVTVKAVVD
jgi:cytochrome P450